MNTLLAILVLSLPCTVIAQNPITPPGMYIADPEAHVWDDARLPDGQGRIYIYGSRDESDDFWCSYTHHVLWSNDLLNWNVEENAISSKGDNDQIAHHDKLLFAPDCAYRNGTYYLYYCSSGKKLTEGVATSTSPLGPFLNGKQIKGAYQIDPAVFIDDDGQAYYFWGQGNAKMAKLSDNMMEIDTATIVTPLDEPGHKAFHEGSSIRKINEKYYLVFADESRNNRPTCLGYAIAEKPMGPYTYKGVIIDNMGCDPAVWNNHGSIEEFNGQWYVFYHRSSNNSRKFRKACIEPITINSDGTIDEVEMTSQGAGEPIPAIARIEGEWVCLLEGNARVSLLPSMDVPQEGLAQIMNGDKAAFKYINFEEGVNTFEVKILNSKGGTIEIRLDNPDGKLIGECVVDESGGGQSYTIQKISIKKAEGVHALWLVFKGNEESLFDIDWIRFK